MRRLALQHLKLITTTLQGGKILLNESLVWYIYMYIQTGYANITSRV